MEKSSQGLSVSCPKLTHVMRAALPLLRVSQTNSALYPNVNKLVTNGEKVFVKSPVLKTKLHTLLPPSTLIACLDTWLAAIVYCAEN
jgi:hypothetical protein